jgi:nitroreductase
MKSLKLAEKRHSTREFKQKKLSEKDQQYVFDQLESLPMVGDSASIESRFISEGESVAHHLEGLAGYFGNMIYAPHYIALLCSDDVICHKVTGYLGEWFILNALKQNIGTCWLEVKDSSAVKSILRIESPKNVAALIAIGYSKKELQQSNQYNATKGGSLSTLTDLGYPNINAYETRPPVSMRKSITEFVYIESWDKLATIEDLEQLGIHEALFYMRLAPSFENRQPWYFVLKKDEIDLIVENSDHISKTIQGIDAGIAMLYFEVGLHDSGIRGRWDFSDFQSDYIIPENFKAVGRYKYL